LEAELARCFAYVFSLPALVLVVLGVWTAGVSAWGDSMVKVDVITVTRR
jgi:hypothetical protein